MSARPQDWRDWLSRYGIYLAFVVLVGVLAVTFPPFFTPENLLNVLRQTSINGVIAVGMTFVIVTGGIDLSVGSVLALAAVLACQCARNPHLPWMVPILVGLGAGLAVGWLNGILVAKHRLAPFIVTLGTMTAARGAALVCTHGRPVFGLSSAFGWFGSGAVPIFIFLLIVVLGALVLHRTRFGRHVFAVGGNELAARVSGIETDRVLIWVYALTGALTGLAGIVLSSRVMSASPALGEGYELNAIAAVVIGGASLNGGVGTITGSLVGALIIGVMNNGLDMLNVSSYWQQIVKGLIIVLAALMDRKSRR